MGKKKKKLVGLPLVGHVVQEAKWDMQSAEQKKFTWLCFVRRNRKWVQWVWKTRKRTGEGERYGERVMGSNASEKLGGVKQGKKHQGRYAHFFFYFLYYFWSLYCIVNVQQRCRCRDRFGLVLLPWPYFYTQTRVSCLVSNALTFVNSDPLPSGPLFIISHLNVTPPLSQLPSMFYLRYWPHIHKGRDIVQLQRFS
jgi:hypothetical protein